MIRAVIRCECQKCRRHLGRCPHTAATRARRTRHPVLRKLGLRKIVVYAPIKPVRTVLEFEGQQLEMK